MLSDVRQPQLQVTLNGSVLPGVIAADVHANNHLAADRFRVRLAASVAPVQALQQPGGLLAISMGLGGDGPVC